MSRFQYDMTYGTDNDSVIVNFTVLRESPASVGSLSWVNGENVTSLYISRTIYKDVVKGGYEIRTSAKIAYSDLKKVSNLPEPLSFVITFKDGSEATATYSESEWKKDRNIFKKVFIAIDAL